MFALADCQTPSMSSVRNGLKSKWRSPSYVGPPPGAPRRRSRLEEVRRRGRSRSTRVGAPVGVDHDSGGQGAGLDRGEPGGGDPVEEQLFAGPQHERVDSEPVLV